MFKYIHSFYGGLGDGKLLAGVGVNKEGDELRAIVQKVEDDHVPLEPDVLLKKLLQKMVNRKSSSQIVNSQGSSAADHPNNLVAFHLRT